MAERIGVFGGTFDPPHLGHLILASEARMQLNLTRVLWVLTSVPPHKLNRPISRLDDRMTMLKLAIEDEPAFELSTLDVDRPGPHYTVDTLRLVAEKHPEAQIIFLLGGDSLRDLPTWHEPQELVKACDEVGVMRRPDDLIDLSSLEQGIPGLKDKVRFVEAPLLEIASHQIRERAASAQPFRYYVPKPVFEYIMEKMLYVPRPPSS